MDFHADDQQEMMREAVKAFADKTLRDAAGRWDAEATVPAAALTQLADLGVFGLAAPEELGGLDVGMQARVAAVEELAAAEAGTAMLVVQHALCLDALHATGAATALQTWGEALASGKVLGCLAHGEDAVHPDGETVRLVATRALGQPGPDGWTLLGEKPHVLGAARASLAVVSAQTEAGVWAFLVDLTGPAVTRTALADPLGLRTAGLATVRLDDAPAVELGPMQRLETVLDFARLGTAAVAVGVARGALRAAGRYSMQREQFGKPIATLQPVQWQVADSAVDLEVARSLVQRAAWLVENGKPARAAIGMAKVAACEAAVRITDRAIQIHGGYGYTTDFPVERAYRDAAVLQDVHGSSPGHKVRVARALAAGVR